MGKRSIFRAYNQLKKEPNIDVRRLNKALGLAQTKGWTSKYYTTPQTCTCPDKTHRSEVLCKHQLAMMLLDADVTMIKIFEGEIR